MLGFEVSVVDMDAEQRKEGRWESVWGESVQ